jgi:hypothetical protein
MIARRRYRALRPAAWAAVFAILLQALLPAVHHPAGMALAGTGDDKIAGLDVGQYLCIAPGSTTPAGPEKAPVHHVQPCALCLAVHAIGGFAPPSGPAVIVPYGPGIIIRTAVALIPPPLPRTSSKQQPRAPPIPV